MPAEVAVGPPILSINRGTTFMVPNQHGDIHPDSAQGVFAHDTRYVSELHLSVNGKAWQLLTSAAIHHYAAQLHLVNPRLATPDGEILASQLGLSLVRVVADGIHEDLDITNHAPRTVRFQFGICLRSDFADIFEVRSCEHRLRRTISTSWHSDRCELITTYTNQGFHRSLTYRLSSPRRA